MVETLITNVFLVILMIQIVLNALLQILIFVLNVNKDIILMMLNV